MKRTSTSNIEETTCHCVICGDEWINYDESDYDGLAVTIDTRKPGVAIGVCEKCLDENAFKFWAGYSKESMTIAGDTSYKWLSDYSAIPYLYTPTQLHELVERDIKERIANGTGQDFSRIMRGLSKFAHENADAFADYVIEQLKNGEDERQ